MHPEAQRLVEQLGLEPHPEGGYFRETFRSSILVEAHGKTRNAITSIDYLLPAGAFSAFHRLSSDEIWHHHCGSPLAIEIIEPNGVHRQAIIGAGDRRQAAIRAGAWFAAHVCDAAGYAIVGCDVAPGFAFEDFDLASRQDLRHAYPQHAALIERWTQRVA